MSETAAGQQHPETFADRDQPNSETQHRHTCRRSQTDSCDHRDPASFDGVAEHEYQSEQHER